MQGIRIDAVDAASETRADIEIEDQAQVQAKALDSSDVVDTDYDEGLNTHSIFFLFPLCKKSLICLEGKSMTPRQGNTILFRSSQQLPRLRLGPSKGFLS